MAAARRLGARGPAGLRRAVVGRRADADGHRRGRQGRRPRPALFGIGRQAGVLAPGSRGPRRRSRASTSSRTRIWSATSRRSCPSTSSRTRSWRGRRGTQQVCFWTASAAASRRAASVACVALYGAAFVYLFAHHRVCSTAHRARKPQFSNSTKKSHSILHGRAGPRAAPRATP